LNLDNLAFESVAAAADGKIYTARVRELQPDDWTRITQIVRNYSENATLLLYIAYLERKDQIIQDIGESGLDRVLNAFESLDKQYQGNINILKADKDAKRRIMNALKRFVASFSDTELFSPYGPIQATFVDGVKDYIDRAVQERNKSDRDTFRMGIEIAGNLIGGVVFDFIKKDVDAYKTIGDIGVYTENTHAARSGWRYALYPVLYFINSVVERYEDKGANLYISATTHPCNFETQKVLSKESGFIELGNRSTDYGHRRRFVCKYSDFIGPVK
jgi:hypothetical protein